MAPDDTLSLFLDPGEEEELLESPKPVIEGCRKRKLPTTSTKLHKTDPECRLLQQVAECKRRFLKRLAESPEYKQHLLQQVAECTLPETHPLPPVPKTSTECIVPTESRLLQPVAKTPTECIVPNDRLLQPVPPIEWKTNPASHILRPFQKQVTHHTFLHKNVVLCAFNTESFTLTDGRVSVSMEGFKEECVLELSKTLQGMRPDTVHLAGGESCLQLWNACCEKYLLPENPLRNKMAPVLITYPHPPCQDCKGHQCHRWRAMQGIETLFKFQKLTPIHHV